MSDPIICTHRWISPEVVDPGYCQCQRWANHEPPHRCCCGDEDDNSEPSYDADHQLRNPAANAIRKEILYSAVDLMDCWHAADAAITAIRKSHAIVLLPEPDSVIYPDEDCNGYRTWDYPHGSVTVFDDGTVEWGQWHGIHPQELRDAAAALLAAANAAERKADDEPA